MNIETPAHPWLGEGIFIVVGPLGLVPCLPAAFWQCYQLLARIFCYFDKKIISWLTGRGRGILVGS
jgi:hypothetical protein